MPKKSIGLPAVFVAGPTVDEMAFVADAAVIALFGKSSFSVSSTAKQINSAYISC